MDPLAKAIADANARADAAGFKPGTIIDTPLTPEQFAALSPAEQDGFRQMGLAPLPDDRSADGRRI